MAVGDKTNIPSIKDLTGVMSAMIGKVSGVLGFVGQQAVIIEPIADAAHDVGGGATVTTVNGVITAKTAPTTPVAAQTWTVAVGDVVVIGEGGVIESITPA